jgi:hypothetical protein
VAKECAQQRAFARPGRSLDADMDLKVQSLSLKGFYEVLDSDRHYEGAQNLLATHRFHQDTCEGRRCPW